MLVICRFCENPIPNSDATEVGLYECPICHYKNRLIAPTEEQLEEQKKHALAFFLMDTFGIEDWDD